MSLFYSNKKWKIILLVCNFNILALMCVILVSLWFFFLKSQLGHYKGVVNLSRTLTSNTRVSPRFHCFKCLNFFLNQFMSRVSGLTLREYWRVLGSQWKLQVSLSRKDHSPPFNIYLQNTRIGQLVPRWVTCPWNSLRIYFLTSSLMKSQMKRERERERESINVYMRDSSATVSYAKTKIWVLCYNYM